jgi:hypothetical protein
MKRNYSLYVELPEVEIRKAEVVEGSFTTKAGEEKVTRKIELAVDDKDLNRVYLVDKDLSHEELYKRGTIGTFKLKIDLEEEFGTKAKIHILEFIPEEAKA